MGHIFIMPFIFFSMTGGFLADHFSKRAVTVWTKVMEIASMLLALAGLAMSSLPLQLTAIFLLSTQGALFSPSKYGLLPELLPQKRLSWGNGVLELTTFLAIILGTVTGASFARIFAGRLAWAGGILERSRCLDISPAWESRAFRPPIRQKNSAPIFWATCSTSYA